MKISVFGTGYVGLVTGVCFAEMGNDVICMDIDPKRIALLNDGKTPIYEPGLEDLIITNRDEKRLQFTMDIKKAVQESDLLFIAVGTPESADGSADLTQVYKVAESIGQELNQYKVIINKSTVPMGTQKKVKEIVAKALKQRGLNIEFDVVSNPEFLREGTAITDCLKPGRVVVGCESEKAAELMGQVYEPFLKSGNPLLFMDPVSSEMTKYAANAMLAAKISLVNEFSRICDKVGADIESVRKGIGSDVRIGPHFIFAGVGYGGSCFPKDIQSLIHMGKTLNSECRILQSVEETNELQKNHFFEKVKKACGNSLGGKTIALWGVAFKPGTDDIREAPAVYLIERLLEEGATVHVYDPVAEPNLREKYQDHSQIVYFEDQYDVLKGADVLMIVTEWKSFKNPDFARIKTLLKYPVVCDGRNIYNPKHLRDAGINYYSVGRPMVLV